MLNLVQLQERLKDLPMQALMQYANGASTQVPPFLALGELNRRKKMQEGAAAQQAQEMEGAPTIKEQIEQSAGLLALQGSRQRQAAQQQAGVQAAMPMAAPNTTTSEPAQLAGGGFIDDIVVPRDYQMGGGVINPEALKQVMYREAMQGDVADIPKELMDAVRKQALRRAPGIPGLPMSRDMFKRGDYAGGGIVAFDAGGSVKRVSGKTLDEYLASVEATLSGMSNLTDAEKRQRVEIAKQQFMQSPPDSPDQPDYPDETKRGSRMEPPSARRVAPPPSTFEVAPERPRAAAGLGGLSALRRALNLDPAKVFSAQEPRSVEDLLTEQKRLQGIAGISEEFLNARDRRLAELQSKREETRARQPIEQLSEFLGGLAQARGGTFGTQIAQGGTAANRLRAQQEALRDKQDMEMEDLKFAIETKRDALRRGDLKEAQAQNAIEQKLKRDIIKDQVELANNQARLETQGRQVEYYGQQVSKPTDYERQRESYLRHARETGERPTELGFQKFILGGKASMVMTREDAIARAIQSLGPGASMEEIRARAEELLKLGGASGGPSVTVPSGVKVTREK